MAGPDMENGAVTEETIQNAQSPSAHLGYRRWYPQDAPDWVIQRLQVAGWRDLVEDGETNVVGKAGGQWRPDPVASDARVRIRLVSALSDCSQTAGREEGGKYYKRACRAELLRVPSQS